MWPTYLSNNLGKFRTVELLACPVPDHRGKWGKYFPGEVAELQVHRAKRPGNWEELHQTSGVSVVNIPVFVLRRFYPHFC